MKKLNLSIVKIVTLTGVIAFIAVVLKYVVPLFIAAIKLDLGIN